MKRYACSLARCVILWPYGEHEIKLSIAAGSTFERLLRGASDRLTRPMHRCVYTACHVLPAFCKPTKSVSFAGDEQGKGSPPPGSILASPDRSPAVSSLSEQRSSAFARSAGGRLASPPRRSYGALSTSGIGVVGENAPAVGMPETSTAAKTEEGSAEDKGAVVLSGQQGAREEDDEMPSFIVLDCSKVTDVSVSRLVSLPDFDVIFCVFRGK